MKRTISINFLGSRRLLPVLSSLLAAVTLGVGAIVPVSAQTAAPQNQYLGQSGLTKRQISAQLKSQAAPNKATVTPGSNFTPECPVTLKCSYKPAAYQANSSAAFDYGNYAMANRPADLAINQIVIHETEGSLASAVANFQDPHSYVSVQYIVDTDGSIVQTVPLKDIAYQAGNFYVNMHSVGIEHVGYSEEKGITAAQYKASAALSKWLADKFNFTLNRGSVIGHDNVAGPSDTTVAGMHWDPGPYWDWNYYMSLLGVAAPTEPVTATTTAITIYPDYATNKQALQNCTTLPCKPVSALPTSFLALHTGPSSGSPLLSDPYLHNDGSAGTTAQNDWGDQAPSGFSYVVAGHQNGWTAIWYGGQKAWFKDDATATKVAHTIVVTPKTSKPVAVYGQPLPEPTAPGWQQIPDDPGFRLTQMPLTKYTILSGQSYAVDTAVPDDYAEGCANVTCTYPGDCVVVVGKDKYLQIEYNHRIAYVKLADVTLNYLTY